MKTETAVCFSVLAAMALTLAPSGAHAQFDDTTGKTSRGDKSSETREGRHRPKVEEQAKPAAMYPQATRPAPDIKASKKIAPKLEQMMDLYQGEDQTATRSAADEILADASANAYERSLADQIAAQAAYSMKDMAAAQTYLQAALDTNGLDNDGHYQSMHMLAQLQMQDEKYAPALATLDTFLGDTHTQAPADLVMRGNILYRLKRYPEAADALKKGIDAAGAEAKPEWRQLLMATYFDQNKPEEAARIAEEMLAKAPDDSGIQSNLAAIYMQVGQSDKAIAMLEKLRASGNLKDDKDYRNLYATYSNAKGKETQVIEVIKEGMAKGILKPDYQTYIALAQAYYFSDQTAPAIENYRKAAPLAPDGEAYLNLARILSTEGKAADAKTAAQQALDKGVKNPQEAKNILGKK